MPITLSQLRAEAQERSDKSGSDFVTTAQWNIWINRGIRKLWRRVMVTNPAFLEISTDFTLTASSNAFALPTGARLLLNVERDPDSPGRYFLRPTTLSGKNTQDPRVPQFRRNKASVLVEPPEWAPGTYRLYYVGPETVLSSDSDTLDTEIEPWWEYVAVWAAILAKDKEEVGRQELMDELARLEEEMALELRVGDSSMPQKITDVTDLGDPDYLYNRRV